MLYSPSPNHSDILQKVSLYWLFDAAVFFISVSVSFYGGLKFETRASQVQLVCLHVIHSNVVDTLVMHIKCPFHG